MEKEIVMFSRKVRRDLKSLAKYEGSVIHVVDGRSKDVIVSMKILPTPEEITVPETYVLKKPNLSEQKDEERTEEDVS